MTTAAGVKLDLYFGELADYRKLKVWWWWQVKNNTVQVKKRKWHQKVPFDNKTHVTLLHSLLLPTDSLDASKCWWNINTNIHTVGLSPVEAADRSTQGKLLPPGGKRNEKLQRVTLGTSKTSCTRFAPPWRRRWSADRRTSPPWTPGCPLVRKKGWCCWEETRQEWVRFNSSQLSHQGNVIKWEVCVSTAA